jgi:excisionase family DNA binding protein
MTMTLPDDRQGNYIDIGKAAARLGVHRETLRRWDRAGDVIQAKRTPGGYRRFLESDIDRLLTERNTEN